MLNKEQNNTLKKLIQESLEKVKPTPSVNVTYSASLYPQYDDILKKEANKFGGSEAGAGTLFQKNERDVTYNFKDFNSAKAFATQLSKANFIERVYLGDDYWDEVTDYGKNPHPYLGQYQFILFKGSNPFVKSTKVKIN